MYLFLFGAILSLSSSVLGFPQQQLVFNHPLKTKSSVSSVVMQGISVDLLFQNVLARMDKGIPESWDALVNPPVTAGSFGGYKLVPEELAQVIDGWDLNPGLVDQVNEDVSQFIEVHSREFMYVAEQFQYNIPGCRDESPLSLCLFTIVVVARQHGQDLTSAEPNELELFHLYIESSSNAVQQHMLFCGQGDSQSRSPSRLRGPLRLSSEDTLYRGSKALDVAPEIDSLMVGLGDIRDIWETIKSIFMQKVNVVIQRHVCLGFSKYQHDVTALNIKDLSPENFEMVVDTLMFIAKVPPTEEMKNILKMFKLSPDLKWAGETVSYTGTDGIHRFLYLYKHATLNHQGETKINLVFGSISGDFTMSPDLLVVHRQTSQFGGLVDQKELIFQNVPHNASATDVKFMQTFFEYVGYRKLAMVVDFPEPPLPNITGVCDIKF
ncbi:hypothetical protein EMPS_07197 [Entomortierella parvispora]|uniref:Uncharacterized protein n=1 Tax=Entomortierella parvispora TaxID=205924 RepID=A0A9P3HDR4_9FUNG|nr:hypothetical protein EMPS_07197 [Entomortierella parvispora]